MKCLNSHADKNKIIERSEQTFSGKWCSLWTQYQVSEAESKILKFLLRYIDNIYYITVIIDQM